MKQSKFLNIKGTLLDKKQIEIYLEKIANEHTLQKKSNKSTYPINRLEENFYYITKTYDLLNLNLKEKIDIHPAGEWLLDNYYVIEETYKTIKKELTLKKYENFIGISDGIYKGFARIYVLACEIVAYTEGKIESKDLKDLLQAYQNKKTLNMEEIWNISLFFNIALIEKIRIICEKIYYAQIQKYKVESIIERLVENIEESNRKFKKDINNLVIEPFSDKGTFIEYLSYRLKLYGKKGLPYIKILEEEVAKLGTTISDVIKKEHFDVAIKKVYIGNCIKSIKDLQRINFVEIFEEINGVENLLKQDPAGVYENMDHETKNNYRTVIKELSNKTKISELYITTKLLELAKEHNDNENNKKSHIGYYLISDGKSELEEKLGIRKSVNINKKNIYIGNIIFFTSIINFLISLYVLSISNFYYALMIFILLYIPISEIVIKLQQYILSKIVRPKNIPKLYFPNDIPDKYTTMVVIPTILDSTEKVKKMYEQLEVFYLANKTENLYFTLLGDCTSSTKQEEELDNQIIKVGKDEIERLNLKYKDNKYNKFSFIYRQRTWNPKENCFLGWERKRGILAQFNEFLLGNNKEKFLYNSMENGLIPNIKYVITLDADTNLVLNSAKPLIGAMAHILNVPVINQGKTKVIDGYGIIQPRIGIDIESTNKSIFTKIFAGKGGVDVYSNAVSDIYQDNFNEGIFTGKGIYDLQVFNEIMKETIPDNTILSHDLLEGLYLRCGLATDILLFDSYPSNYNSDITRQCRWVRGDWQIINWLKKKVKNRKGYTVNNPISELDKFKIIDNLRRSLLGIMQVLSLTFILIINLLSNIKINGILIVLLLSIFIDFIIEVINNIIYKKEGVKKQESFSNDLGAITGVFLKSIINLINLPFRSYSYLKAIIKTIYRIYKTKCHLLEWITAEEAEKNAENTIGCYIKQMWVNIAFGILFFNGFIINNNIVFLIFSVLWMIAPFICYKISKPIKEIDKKENLNNQDIKYLEEIAKKTWGFFETYLTQENNYLPPDNYQKSRKPEIVYRTSSTNIGLAVISIISAYDLKLIDLGECLDLIEKIIVTINKLPKWNGHLYNWYNILTLEPLKPAYVSTVDSGNFVGYMYILKIFLENQLNKQKDEEKKVNLQNQINYIKELIEKTNFEKLYDKEIGLLSIGFNVEENKLTPSYYDLLASEARQASLIAIAKKDIPTKHWSNLSRTLTLIDRKKGLISWSGTAFEYLMPNINIKKYEGSLLDESCKFMIMSQKKYCSKLGIPWGISESAFNLKDLNSNYQYKAFGIPWLGLKRGLADEVVVSSYGSIMALPDYPVEVIKNIKELEKKGMYDKFGFYESIDYTPDRLSKNKKYEIVQTYMTHHQALILASINNFLNNNIMQKRFFENPEIKAIDILLQEKMPRDVIITKEKKEVVEKIKYDGYENYLIREVDKIDERLNNSNVIASEDYTVCFFDNGTGYSKYKDILINRYKETEQALQGIEIIFKNIDNNKIWSSYIAKEDYNKKNYKIEMTPDMNKITKKEGDIETIIKNIIAPNENVEIRNIKIKNKGNKENIIEIYTLLEPILSSQNQDIAHKAFNNLFLKYEKLDEGLLVKRNKRGAINEIYMAVGLYANKNEIGKLQYEIDKEKLYGRLNKDIPNKIKTSEQFSNEIGLVTDPIIALKRTVRIKPDEDIELNLIISVSEEKIEAIHRLNKYQNIENIKKAFEISKIRTEEEARYLRIKGKDIILYQKLLSYILNINNIRKKYLEKIPRKQYSQRELWKYGISGDLPIILVKVKEENDIYVVKEILKAYEYFITKNIKMDLVIINNEVNIYEKYLKNEIEREIYSIGFNYLINNKIFIIDKQEVEDIYLFEFKSSVILNAHLGNLENIIEDLQEQLVEKNSKIIDEKLTLETNFEKYDINKMNLKYENGYGGFSEDGREYVIAVSNQVPSVWSNILTNGKIGSVVTQNLGGYTWSKNSRLNRISRWSNDSVLDTPSEAIYIRDYTSNKYWRIGDGNLLAKYGFGFAYYEQKTKDIKQELTVFVPINNDVKVNILKITNMSNQIKTLNLIYKIDNVLGEDELKTNGYIDLKYNKEENYLFCNNLYEQDVNEKMYLYSSEPIQAFSGDNSSIKIDVKKNLDNENSLGNNSCAAIQINIELDKFEEKEVVFVLGSTNEIITTEFKDINKCKKELFNTKRYWSEMLEKIRVKTQVESFNIMMNGWSMYQTISSRLLARSGFNQSGGAFGFRDQLQDCVGLEYIDVDMVKQQILKHAAHQFIEGDVEHWWHEESKRGIRTKFSDDRLWLVYLTLDYIDFTGDEKILEEKIPYITGKILKEDEDENYDVHEESQSKESLYSHCIRAINISLKFGENGLPLIGSGDWNDGLNTVGNKGKGESVWLGFFLYDILNRFIKILEKKKDIDLINQYNKILLKLKKALNTNGWDGHWYKRAFTDEGEVLGSIENEECRIDSIAQSWSVISEAGDNDKKYIALKNLETYLIDSKVGIIKLLDPPFENSNLEPGYIKSYLPGVRENGGQYTHAAIWSIIAFAKLGLKEKTEKYFTMINPIEHSKTKERADLYKIEPYVIAADIYGSKNLLRTRRLELVYRFFKLVL